MWLIGVAAALSLLSFVQSRLHCPIPPSQGRHGTCPDFWTRIGNSCYLFSTDLKTWEEAVNTCRFPGGDLVTVLNSVEHDELLLQAFQATSWIGLNFKDSRWQWSDGQPLLFTNWANGEPSDPENERCVEMMHWLGGEHGKWNDLNCNEYKGFICELDLEVECSRHSICEWDGDCYLKSPEQGVGFVIASEVQETEDGFQVRLQHSGNGDMFGQIIQELMFQVTKYDEAHVGFKIFDPNHPRYEPPVPLNLRVDEAAADYQYDVLLDSTTIGQPFHFKVIRTIHGMNRQFLSI
ncbi:unnamed protein product [Cyprideis torosa]|uniref:Uncharacterized protein n=1 Tax=Cyprideis torosa TaxID=163714 RepID=A0A7R8ZJK6_9CRUS|nr:unnamed protein product [Cyprideis torosa]CAG0882497.1 unnamed protein product [Cyprideis torosa]